MGEPSRKWVVFSTVLLERWLLVEDVLSGEFAAVMDPSREEWAAAFHAPSAPYEWSGGGHRVRPLPTHQAGVQ